MQRNVVQQNNGGTIGTASVANGGPIVAKSTDGAAKFVLKQKTEAGLVDVGLVIDKTTDKGLFYIVDGTDLIIGQNEAGDLLLKQKDESPDAKYSYRIITRLFENESKAGNKYHRGKTQDGTVYMMFLNTPKPAGKGGFGGGKKVSTQYGQRA